MRIYEAALNDAVMQTLIELSAAWEAENSCHGYRKNAKEDISGNRVWLAEEDGAIIGYLFGHMEKAKNFSTIMPADTPYFEIEELYVVPAYRCRGVGKELFFQAEKQAKEDGEASFLMLSTATKNWKAILHFYLEETGMEFWSARLFKKIR